MNLLYKDESYAIVGALFEVYNELGCGFLEDVYQEALIREFPMKQVPFVSQPKLEIKYKGELLSKKYEPDFVCYSKIIVEIKAVSSVQDVHRAQVFNYLKATGFKLAFLVNFGASQNLEYHRIARS